VIVADVTLREHGQNVRAAALDRFTVELRVATARALIDAGVRRLEILSCVSPRVAPAMAPELLAEVARGVGRRDGVRIVTLVPNLRGYETFRDCGLVEQGHAVGLFLSADPAHNRANLGRSVGESLNDCEATAGAAQADGAAVVGYVSGAWGWQPSASGEHEPLYVGAVITLARRLAGLGCETVTLSDLQGLASALRTRERLEEVRRELPGNTVLGHHPHHADPATSVALASAAYDGGARLLDGSLGATGGCVVGEAPGNAPTEGILAMLEQRGVASGVDRAAVEAAAQRFHESQQGG